MNYQEQTDRLFDEQLQNWDLLRTNVQGLEEAITRSLPFEGFTINLQFNPRRIRSSGAKVDKASIEQRPCFLCAGNRPPGQESVPFENDYEILCNPYPIFPRHYTIAHKEHVPQRIRDSFPRLLELSRALPDLAVFYNGPRCGASAPDHLHFQAGNRGFMPIEHNYHALLDHYGEAIPAANDLRLVAVDDGLRRFIAAWTRDRQQLENLFSRLYDVLLPWYDDQEEPMLNILSWYNEGWRVLFFPRERHRPWQFFEEGEKNLLLSPAAVDFGGTLIFPLEKDFVRVTASEVRDVFDQVSLSPERFSRLKSLLNPKSQHKP